MSYAAAILVIFIINITILTTILFPPLNLKEDYHVDNVETSCVCCLGLPLYYYSYRTQCR